MSNDQTMKFIKEIMKSLDFDLAGFSNPYEMIAYILCGNGKCKGVINESNFKAYMGNILGDKTNRLIVDRIMRYVENNTIYLLV